MNPAPGERDDAALVAAALDGEDRAFTELMRRHKEPIYRFVRHYVGDADEAYDLVQETFVAAWSALSSFDARRPMSAAHRAQQVQRLEPAAPSAPLLLPGRPS